MQVFKADAAKEANVVPCEAWSGCLRRAVSVGCIFYFFFSSAFPCDCMKLIGCWMLHLSFWQAHWGHPLQGYDAHVERYRTERGSEEHHPVVVQGRSRSLSYLVVSFTSNADKSHEIGKLPTQSMRASPWSHPTERSFTVPSFFIHEDERKPASSWSTQ